ncbi:hypothetical protein C1637_09885 [Chryseobacterium lactis]|uniref:Uncharacterized protein n=1 Tax=Chryseobacterium lactis TaxID=1241981 RepID=A0A3G6RM01_CHRLC|nr:terminase family protein [Chryseobacterium lactis]AZA82179.1 hypothetical protein EG342_09815 [Chryseobacterium lactis]AZB02560.1 hypothetical protein EG341_00670 [Chryseobacterium lactis]PNW14145.1 hypothetical protein C1637_09885 [Chryseobacterium lactis]
MDALSSPADILIGGAAAGVGKTFSLLLEPIRHINVENFGAVIFRKTTPMIRTEGGLWDSSKKIYGKISGADPREYTLEWRFESGVKLKFSHLDPNTYEMDWQGPEIPLICFDELTHFSRKMFFYMLSRNRSTCGVKPYVRATCNPDPDSWVADFIAWWIDQDPNSPNYGFPIPERQGVLRYFYNQNNELVWGSSYDEVYRKCQEDIDAQVQKSKGLVQPNDFIKSVTFIAGSIYDNQELLRVNPAYLGNLNAQDEAERQRLLLGNWKVSSKGDDIYSFKKFLDIFTNSFVPHGEKRITTDIAMKGSNKFTIWVWSGKRVLDFFVMDKSKGNEVIDLIKQAAFSYNVPESNILFDNDGVGQFVDGFIQGAQEFNNGSRPLPNDETEEIENYFNLKTQCYYKSGEAVSMGEYYIPPEVANKRYDDEMTLKERMIWERKAIKRDKIDDEGKLRIMKKSEMKNLLSGESPDVLDGFMMNEWWYYKVNQIAPVHSHSSRDFDNGLELLNFLD